MHAWFWQYLFPPHAVFTHSGQWQVNGYGFGVGGVRDECVDGALDKKLVDGLVDDGVCDGADGPADAPGGGPVMVPKFALPRDPLIAPDGRTEGGLVDAPAGVAGGLAEPGTKLLIFCFKFGKSQVFLKI